MRARRPGAAFLLLLLLFVPASCEEGRTFRKAWGRAFNKLGLHPPGGANHTAAAAAAREQALQAVRGAAGEFRDSAAQLQAALLARLRGDGGGGGIAAAGGPGLAPHWEPDDWAGLLHPLNLTLSLLEESSAAWPTTAPNGSSGHGRRPSKLLAALDAALPLDLGGVDVHRLAAVALLQGWALRALTKAHHAGAAASSSGPAAGQPQLAGPGGAGAALPHLLPAQHGARDPLVSRVRDPAWGSFRGRVCLKLSNFGDGDGYRPAYLGPPPAGSPGEGPPSDEQVERFAWGAGGAGFLLDCSREAGGAPDVAAAAARLRCRLAVATDAGRALLLRRRLAEEPPASHGLLAAAAAQINAVRLRVCNLVPAYVEFPATVVGPAGRVALSRLVLDGHELAPALSAPRADPGGGAASAGAVGTGCVEQLYRLAGPAKPSPRGFALSGWLDLGAGDGQEAGGPDSGRGTAPRLGVGDMASLEVTLGDYHVVGF